LSNIRIKIHLPSLLEHSQHLLIFVQRFCRDARIPSCLVVPSIRFSCLVSECYSARSTLFPSSSEISDRYHSFCRIAVHNFLFKPIMMSSAVAIIFLVLKLAYGLTDTALSMCIQQNLDLPKFTQYLSCLRDNICRNFDLVQFARYGLFSENSSCFLQDREIKVLQQEFQVYGKNRIEDQFVDNMTTAVNNNNIQEVNFTRASCVESSRVPFMNYCDRGFEALNLRRDLIHDALLSGLVLLNHSSSDIVLACSQIIWRDCSVHISQIFS
jgi:hypothetical protein